MSKQNDENVNQSSIVENGIFQPTQAEATQITVKDTGWSEEEKERMEQYGYDSLDMIREWYS